MNYYLYVETAFHHEGDKEYLLKLIDEAKKSGAKGIKFQVLINLNEFMSSKHSSFKEAKSWILTLDDWREVFNYTQKLALDIILMPLDIMAFKLINEFKISFLEIHSVSFKDKKLLDCLQNNTLPLIFGIGGRTLKEIDDIVNKYQNREIILMVGIQSFPSNLKDIKIERIKFLKEKYSNCIIGYADHSSFDDTMAISSNEYAYILGARIFEKHITIDEGKKRIDFQSAVSAKKIEIIIDKLNYLESILTDNVNGLFKMSKNEIIYRNRQKVPVANKNILKNDIVTLDMIDLKMVNADSFIDSTDNVVNRKATKNISIDENFTEGNIV